MSPRSALFLFVMVVGCGSGTPPASASRPRFPWDLDASELLVHGEAVIEAVASLPECTAAIEKGGHIHWRASPWNGTWEGNPPVLDLPFESSWGPASYTSDNWPNRSTLATVLCRLCGYGRYVAWEIDSCVERARAAFMNNGGLPTRDEPIPGWDQDASELVEQGKAVVAAVAAVSPCPAAMERGGQVRWRARLTSCTQCDPHITGCYHPESCGSDVPICYHSESAPARVEVVFESAYLENKPPTSGLAHELCHICGYVDELDAQRCDIDARQHFQWP